MARCPAVSNAILLGVIADADGDEIEVSVDGDGTVVLEWEHGSAMTLGRVARDKLRELLDRAAMPGQAREYRRPCCDHCNNLAGDPDGHDYGDETAHDGPCEQCADEQAREEAIRDAE